MADTLVVFGKTFTDVVGIKATDDNDTVKAYVRPEGTKSITANGNNIDVTSYAAVNVNVSGGSISLQSKSKSYTPSETAQSETVTADTGYSGLSSVAVSVGAISSSYVGSGIARRSSSDLTASTLTVTAPSGYYSSNATKTLSDANLVAGNIKSGTTIFGVTGSYEGSGGGGGSSSMSIDTISEPTAGTSTSLTFSNLKGEPTSFSVMIDEDSSPGTTAYVIAIVYDGTSHHAQTITNTNNAQITYTSTGLSHSYSNGTLTITSTGTAIDTVKPYYLIYTYGGTASNIHTSDVQVGSGATSITFTDLDDEPEYWSCIFKSNFSTSSGYQRVVFVQNDGSTISGIEMDSAAKTALHWTSSYSNGSLTITSNGTNQGGYFHQPGYYQLTYAIGGDQTLQTKTVTPTTSTQNVTADTAQGYTALKKVVVNPIPSTYVEPTTTVGATTYRASTSNQTINAGTYHSAAATIAAVSQTNLSAENIKSGTTISISNGQSNLWSVTGTYTGSGGGTSWAIGTKTATASNRPTSLSFTSMSGQPRIFALRCTTAMSRSSNSSYYYVADMFYDGTNTKGNCWRMSNGNWTNITSGYSWTYSGTTLTVSSSGTSTTSPGCFYNGTYELVYVY